MKPGNGESVYVAVVTSAKGATVNGVYSEAFLKENNFDIWEWKVRYEKRRPSEKVTLHLVWVKNFLPVDALPEAAPTTAQAGA